MKQLRKKGAPTLRDVAKEAGYSHQTGSRVINQVPAGLAACLSRFGQVNVIAANAALMEKALFLEMREEERGCTIAVNLKRVFFWGQAVAAWMGIRWMFTTANLWTGPIAGPQMGEDSNCTRINIACIRAELATEGLSAYIASKGGVKMLTKAMAVELPLWNPSKCN
jgi:NAD(P)-dependent dehydrogenase (short-subunit alcohol dehydrogenase family)